MKRLLSVVLLILSYNVHAVNVNTYIPEKAKLYLPVVKKEQITYFSTIPTPEYFGGLIEQESCISLTHSRCWSPSSKLQTSRELGIGLSQLTKAYKEDGSIRFDSLKAIRDAHKAELKEMAWDNIAVRPDLQIRSMILMAKDNYARLYEITDPKERLYMTDAAYNQGLGGVFRDRRLCSLSSNCDAKKWFKNVELSCGASKRKLYGDRSACDISRQHVLYACLVRSNKYKPYLENKI